MPITLTRNGESATLRRGKWSFSRPEKGLAQEVRAYARDEGASPSDPLHHVEAKRVAELTGSALAVDPSDLPSVTGRVY